MWRIVVRSGAVRWQTAVGTLDCGGRSRRIVVHDAVVDDMSECGGLSGDHMPCWNQCRVRDEE